MLRDVVRNEAYRRAIAHVVKPGNVVLDMGAGTGILSIFAAAAGARKVYAVERTDVATVARRVVERNGHADRILVLQSDLEDVRLPEKVDVIVSEWMGGLGVDENMIAPLVMARDRWLTAGGRIVPGRVTAMLAPASMPDLDESVAYWRSRPHGVDMSVIATMTTHETHHTHADLSDALLAEPKVMWSHDPYTCSLEEADQPFTTKLAFVAARAGTVSGFATWFTAEMGDGGTLTNAVGAPDTHWGQTVFPLDHAIEVAAGDPIHIELHCDPSVPGTCEFYWSAKVADHPLERHDTRRDHAMPIR
jgi:cyclopropane fatty-acyl-phospholipid synthase-like methyltransferase